MWQDSISKVLEAVLRATADVGLLLKKREETWFLEEVNSFARMSNSEGRWWYNSSYVHALEASRTIARVVT